MKANYKVYCAVTAILGANASVATAAAPAEAAPAGSDEGSLAISEVTVTAQRRTENVQNVPIAIQALTSETLQQLNVQTFDDYAKYVPSVTFKSNGPGQSLIYMRGLSSGASAGSQSTGTIGGFPNVAIYLDDQSGQLPGRNLDIYAADLERIEVLEGPQGTLFGAGAEAGVVRYITNKPKLNVTEGSATASYGTTAHGDNNSSITAVLNLPVIPDTLAVRAVIYNDNRGGYIDNVPGTFTRKATDLGIYYANYPAGCKATKSCQVPPGSPIANNNALVQNNFNPVTYQGVRASVLYQINDDWSALVTQSYQDMNAQGVFYQMPNSSDGVPLQPLQVTVFSPSSDKDKFENTAWTVNGKIGDLKAIYTGGYLVRNLDQRNDYTSYARGVYADYYQCYGASGSAGGTGSARCFSPVTSWREQLRNTHQTHEFRLSTPDDWRARGIIGAFWENEKIFDNTDWLYKTVPTCTAVGQGGCFSDVATAPGATSNIPGTRNDSTAFFEDIQRGYKQYAFFTSLDFDIIPKVLTITGGTRFYHFDNFQTGSVVSSFYCFNAGPGPCNGPKSATNINAEGETSTYTGTRSRGNLTWHITPDIMAYYTYSQGFRPGLFNRQSGCHVPDPTTKINLYCIPLKIAPDSLTNNEVGWKTEFFDHRLQFNGAIYQEKWTNVQVGFFDPGQLGNLTFGTNGQNFRVRGIEGQLVGRVTQGLTVTGAASYNKSEQTNSPALIANNPALLANPLSAGLYGKPITAIANPFGAVGSPTANSPLFQGNIRARYEWAFNQYNMFAQVGATYSSSSFTQTGNNPSLSTGGAINTTLLRFENPSYGLVDASIGIAKDQWTAQLFGENLADRNVSLFTSTSQFVVTQTPNRPRVLGLTIGYKF
ncbi:MAG: TonB-dependent receptor [Gammaproteobacteria bacterium]|nr:TonB-dependent receptor [Gammaproteobacteria bacterium]